MQKQNATESDVPLSNGLGIKIISFGSMARNFTDSECTLIRQIRALSHIFSHSQIYIFYCVSLTDPYI